MNRTYQVAGHRFMLWGDKLCKAVEGIAGFRPFESQDGEVLFAFMEDTAVPVMGKWNIPSDTRMSGAFSDGRSRASC